MKFLSFKARNFRMLRKCDFHFSIDGEKHVTVIRAQNETGKTTLWRAIAWTIYGEKFLKTLTQYSLTPDSWAKTDGETTCDIQCELEFTEIVETFYGSTENKYKLIRYVTESKRANQTDDMNFSPTAASRLKLFKITNKGWSQIDGIKAENLIHKFFPFQLLNIFFLNGDDIYTFMFNKSDTASQRRNKVEQSLRDVLDVVTKEKAVEHLKTLVSRLTVSEEFDFGEDENLGQRVVDIQQKIDDLEGEAEKKNEQINNITSRIDENDKVIENIVAEGDRDDLSQQIKDIQEAEEDLQTDELEAAKAHSKLLAGKDLGIDSLASPILVPISNTIAELYKEGFIPAQTVPFLQKKLDSNEDCICGESLSKRSAEGKERRKHIQSLIDESLEQDEVSKLITALDHEIASHNLFKQEARDQWIAGYNQVQLTRIGLKERRDKLGTKKRNLKNQLLDLTDTDVPKLQEEIAELTEERKTYKDKLENINVQRGILTERLRIAQKDFDQYQSASATHRKAKSLLILATDALLVFQTTLEVLTNDKTKEVSAMMNSLFLNMTNSEDAKRGPIRKVEITEDKEILVTSQGGSTYPPGDNLNGASLRALTLAFVLSLCKASGKQLPNIIDTPFGTMSGLNKVNIARGAIENSSQLILCATVTEIREIEKVITHNTKKENSYTMSFAAHYDHKIKNKISHKPETIICECNIYEICEICDRFSWDDPNIFPKEAYSIANQNWGNE